MAFFRSQILGSLGGTVAPPSLNMAMGSLPVSPMILKASEDELPRVAHTLYESQLEGLDANPAMLIKRIRALHAELLTVAPSKDDPRGRRWHIMFARTLRDVAEQSLNPVIQTIADELIPPLHRLLTEWECVPLCLFFPPHSPPLATDWARRSATASRRRRFASSARATPRRAPPFYLIM